jgi:hypothetical protein
MKLSKESHAISHSLNSYMKEHANEPMGHEKKEAKAKALKKAKGFEEAKKKTYGIHQLGLRDEPRHKTLSGKEVKY